MISHISETIILTILLAIGSGACGKKRDNQSSENLRPILISSNEPADYALYDAECQVNTETVDIDQTEAWGSAGLQLFSGEHLVGTRTERSLQSPQVNSTKFARRFSRSCNNEKLNGEWCRESDGNSIGYKTEIRDSFLRVCHNGFNYPRDSYEAAALTSVVSINRAAGTYNQAMGKKLAPIELEVFPIFETTINAVSTASGEADLRMFVTDNLAYYPSRSMIVLFPQSKRSQIDNRDRFWEYEFVLAHELGHHIEEIHIGRKLKANGLRWDPRNHLYRSSDGMTQASAHFETNDLAPTEEPSAMVSSVNSKAQYWTAVSEGFADLIAFYATRESLESIENLDCIGRNRNITTSYFGDGITKKVLNEEALLRLRNGIIYNYECDAVEMGDPHIVGAILAHAWHKILLATTGELDSQNMFAAPSLVAHSSMNILLRYKKEIELVENFTDKAISRGQENIFLALGPALEEVFHSSKDSVKTRICQIAQEHLPVVNPLPFGKFCEKSPTSY